MLILTQGFRGIRPILISWLHFFWACDKEHMVKQNHLPHGQDMKRIRGVLGSVTPYQLYPSELKTSCQIPPLYRLSISQCPMLGVRTLTHGTIKIQHTSLYSKQVCCLNVRAQIIKLLEDIRVNRNQGLAVTSMCYQKNEQQRKKLMN